MWADWYGFKMEAYDAIKENIPLVHNAGACAIVHSDDANGIQRLNQEAAKALADGRRAGSTSPTKSPGNGSAAIPARRSASSTRPARWRRARWPTSCCGTATPSAIYTRPERVWIDGALMYDANDPKRRPVSDFELGQPGEGDVK